MFASTGKMTKVIPFFFQYEVRPNMKNSAHESLAGAIATVIVFAETDELARARAARYVGRNNWEIIEVKRNMLILPYHVKSLDGVLRSVYQKAEQTGIAATFDGWKKPVPKGRNKDLFEK